MNIDDNDTDDIADEHDGNNGNGYAVDPHTLGLMIAVTWCRVANNKALERMIKKLDRLDRKYADTQAKLAALTAQAAEIETALTAREAELAARAAEIERRETELEASLHEARDHLRAYYDTIAEADRHIRYRILSHADLLGGYNAALQDLPGWPAIRRLVVGLPDDPVPIEPQPRIDVLSDTFSDPNADRHGNAFLGSLTRSVSHKATSQ